MSSFDVEFGDDREYKVDFTDINPVLAVINNILTRGLPTKAPIELEKIFVSLGLTKDTNPEKCDFSQFERDGIPVFGGAGIDRMQAIFELLHIIQPGLVITERNYGGALGSHLEWSFITNHPFMVQIIESQRSFSTINNRIQGERAEDFCFTSPYLHYNHRNQSFYNQSRIFEVDGPHHLFAEYQHYDAKRDQWALEVGFETLRFNTLEITENRISYDELISKKQYLIFKKNFLRDYKTDLALYSMIFIPLAIARIQKVLIEVFLNDGTLLQSERLRIAVIERDLPCGAMGISIFQSMLQHLNAILDPKSQFSLPIIELSVFPNHEWTLHQSLHSGASIREEKDFKVEDYDLILDHAILRRNKVYNEPDFVQARGRAIRIRSSHYYDTSFGSSRRMYCAKLLRYKPLVERDANGEYLPKPGLELSINYFIQHLFRKPGFRPGQLPIISRALELKPVIGLLPTGGGKSLAYQLPVFLQPGLCLVVDPIKSLMEDQVRVLKEHWIDCCEFINSNLARKRKEKILIDFMYGETMFLFVSPERLVMPDFRKMIKGIGGSTFGLGFSYCVIDEVHCVSEWGHDFRTTYLMLGKNAQQFAGTRDGSPVTLIGLTATASFDVLTDIERELKIDSEDVNDAIISIDNTIRPELFFSVIENEERIHDAPINEQQLKDRIGEIKQAQINEVIEEIDQKFDSIDEAFVDLCLEQHFRDFELNVNVSDEMRVSRVIAVKRKILQPYTFNSFNDVISVLFCPHTTGSLGITQEANPHPRNKEVFENLIVPIGNKGYFMGGDDRSKRGVMHKIQQYFLDFMNGRINYMVCTKAFGMGIDKEHIRAIYHINLPSSPESYIQEAGRAGRDKGRSICSLFIDRNIYYTVSPDFIKENNPGRFKLLSERKNARAVFEVYNDFQNRFLTLFYPSKQLIIERYRQLGIEILSTDILDFQHDKSVHDYFHKSNFKGIEMELFQLDRLFNFNQGINSKRLSLLEKQYNLEYNEDLRFNLTETGRYAGNLWVNNSEGKAIGKLITQFPIPTASVDRLGGNGEPDLLKTKEVLEFLVDAWEHSDSPGPTLFLFLNTTIQLGLNKGLKFIDYFEQETESSFSFQIPDSFKDQNLATSLVDDLRLNELPEFVQNNTTNEFVETLIEHSSDFDDLILRIEEYWDRNILTGQIYKNNKADYKRKYYSEMNRSDISRLIYRLNAIGLVENYSMDYNLGLFTVDVIKQGKPYYIQGTRDHLLKYLSRSQTLDKIEQLSEITKDSTVIDTIKQCFKTIILFTYDDIVKKRKTAVDDLYAFISDSIEQAKVRENPVQFKHYWFNSFFKEEMYYYFNAKYARVGYTIGGEPYSLLDDTQKGQLSEWATFKKYAEKLKELPSFISECKMMRGSCRRIWRTLALIDYENEYILKILYAFSTYGLNNPYYFSEAEEFFIKGFEIYNRKNKDYKDLDQAITRFGNILLECTKNNTYEPYLHTAKHKIMMKVNLEFAKTLITQLEKTVNYES